MIYQPRISFRMVGEKGGLCFNGLNTPEFKFFNKIVYKLCLDNTYCFCSSLIVNASLKSAINFTPLSAVSLTIFRDFINSLPLTKLIWLSHDLGSASTIKCFVSKGIDSSKNDRAAASSDKYHNCINLQELGLSIKRNTTFGGKGHGDNDRGCFWRKTVMPISTITKNGLFYQH
ncbi:hypothetical protein AGLY_006897 [Aphis glycines]|uniref:Uncharacterized protein n=1 Tax=Aphis glycines TaxID=307491 RepID=A0A6G0TPY7_APHGL|nr:hypothetical protein AGLY_006897 [Aphis glycines]